MTGIDWMKISPEAAPAHIHRLRRYRDDGEDPELRTDLDVIYCDVHDDPRCTLFIYPKPGYRPVGHAGMHSWSTP